MHKWTHTVQIHVVQSQLYFCTIGNSGHTIPLAFSIKKYSVNSLLDNFEIFWLISQI